MRPTCQHPTPACTIATTPVARFFYSYATLIAYEGPDLSAPVDEEEGSRDNVRIRLANYWSKTTARHYSEMGCKDFAEVSLETFAKVIGFTGNPATLALRG